MGDCPWWFTLAGWLGIVPADFLMSHDMLHGVKQRAEGRRCLSGRFSGDRDHGAGRVSQAIVAD